MAMSKPVVFVPSSNISSLERTDGPRAITQRVEITAKRFAYEPDTITLKKEPSSLFCTASMLRMALRSNQP
jgi:hypothetical protein